MGCYRLAHDLTFWVLLLQGCALLPRQAPTPCFVESPSVSSATDSAAAGKTAEQLLDIAASEPADLSAVSPESMPLGDPLPDTDPLPALSDPAQWQRHIETPGLRPMLTPTAHGERPVQLASFQGSDDVADSLDIGASAGGGEAVKLEPAILQAADRPFPINLATALRLSDARPLIVAAAQASAWVAEARLQRAQLLWIPELDFGAVYLRHDGFGPDFNLGNNNPTYIPGQGGPLNQNVNYFYAGGSLYQIVALTDVIFEPLAARKILNSERWNIQTAKNDALLATAKAYFDVHQYRGTYAGALDVVARGHKLVERIAALSKDLAPRVEVDRAKKLLADVEQKAAIARREWRISSANLTQVLRLDPSVVVEPAESDHLQITLIEPDRPLDELIPLGLTSRPELPAQKALVQAAEARIRQEKCRPILPLVMITGFQTPSGMRMQGGVFGTGRGSQFNNWSLRDDISAQLIWQLEGFGFGNLARVKEQRGGESQAIVKLRKIQDTIAAEVTEAQARVQSAAVRVVEAEREIREAIITYDGNFEGLGQTRRFANVLEEVYRPQEAVEALDRLMLAFEHYFSTVADYNRAQFELFHALGYPANEIADRQPPGEIVPVNTERPYGLPAVREGPPPAFR